MNSMERAWDCNGNGRGIHRRHGLHCVDGRLRLGAVSPAQKIANLWSSTNLLLQKLPAPSFVATTRLDASGLRAGERAGLIVMGADYSALVVERNAQGICSRPGLANRRGRRRQRARAPPSTGTRALRPSPPPLRTGVSGSATAGAGAPTFYWAEPSSHGPGSGLGQRWGSSLKHQQTETAGPRGARLVPHRACQPNRGREHHRGAGRQRRLPHDPGGGRRHSPPTTRRIARSSSATARIARR